ncbi:GAF domain-containing sensor histidine kinase [Leptothoe kymatousa]|uniref:histidine kinase n=1 Tax=Leptothoe kymatousa TAU-MAC 1615 TaxID=2364775 RepID=A0ABS5Y431_9CYAN|nr:GAF domain-containing protein [Leptothoe kymatousa]MBT9312600.1 GAF domain-containing protein [Leptothoe kymatousa TAU-MAC 1615]
MPASLTFNSPESQQAALFRVVTRIRQSQDLHRIFKTTTSEIRQLLEADRVAIFYFYPHQDWEGEFVAESVGASWKSALASPVYDHCFSDDFAPLYVQGKTHAIADIYDHGLQDCHIQILSQFQVRANMVVPIVKGKTLWGLLCVHQCEGPRDWKADEIDFVSSIGEQLGIAIQQAEYLQAVKARSDRQKVLVRVLGQIRKSQDLFRTFKTTAQEVRHLLDADRVGIFKFAPEQDWEGEFIAESVGAPWKSALANPVHDHCFGEKFAALYPQRRYCSIPDIYNHDLQDCHIQILEKFEVRANLVVPILTSQTELWGLLCVHQCENPRYWQEDEVEFVNCIAEQLGVAIQQAKYLQVVKERSDRQKILVQAISRIRQSQDIHRIFKTTAQEVRHLLDSDRVGIFKFDPTQDWEGSFIAESVGARWQSTLDKHVHDHCFSDRFAPLYVQGRYHAISDITKSDLQDCHRQILEQFEIRANLVVPINIENKLWGLFCIHQCEGPRHWAQEDIEFVQLLVEHLGVAIQQADYLKKMQQQSARAAAAKTREQLLERQNLIARTVNKIRQSLDIETIFQTTTREVRHLLELDRVAIYQFAPDWSGQFVAESVGQEWDALVGTLTAIKDTFLEDTLGGRYRHQETFTVDDIYTAGYTECHIQLLEQFQAKAYAIAPIFQGENLWGLLTGYQNDGPRRWQSGDVDLMAQIAAQMGLAIQQATLLKATRQQADELMTTLDTLRTTQLQLVQGEKMSSLGQLVAGLAHEINNPVTFIHGNIAHLEEYVGDLLRLLDAYQQHPDLPDSLVSLTKDSDLEFVIQDLPKIFYSLSNGSTRILELVSSLKNFARLDEAEVKAVDLAAGIDSTLLILQHRLKADGDVPAVEIIKRYNDIPTVECYPAQLNQVFMNIISNAIDALHEHQVEAPTVEITLQTNSSNVDVSIANNGPTVPESVIKRMFDPFFTTKPPGKGTGLGLSISYQIVVEHHQGCLTCESSNNKTMFRIQIPTQLSHAD